MQPSTLADLFAAITTDTTQITTDQAAVVADQAKLMADQAAVETEQTQLTTDQSTFAAALAGSGGGFVTNPDGSISLIEPSTDAPGYTATVYQPLSSLPIPIPTPTPTDTPSS